MRRNCAAYRALGVDRRSGLDEQANNVVETALGRQEQRSGTRLFGITIGELHYSARWIEAVHFDGSLPSITLRLTAGLAPCRISSRQHSACPEAAAIISGVVPSCQK